MIRIISTDHLRNLSLDKNSINSFFTKLNIETEIVEFDQVQFIDCGENLDEIRCNKCNRELKVEDWQNLMNKAYKSEFKNLDILCPLCHEKTNLNKLIYYFECGFAKFAIETAPENYLKIEKNKSNIEEFLGFDIKIIRAHY